MGVDPFQQLTMTGEALKALLAEQELYNSYPLWTFIAFRICCFGGIIGNIGLLTDEEKKTKLAFIIPSCHHTTNDSHFFSAIKKSMAGHRVMPILVIVLCISIMVFHFWN
jgi:hypothetical protein